MTVGEALAAEAELVDRAFVADRGDDVLQEPLVGGIVEDVAGGEAADAVAPRHCVERMQPGRIARPAAMGEGADARARRKGRQAGASASRVRRIRLARNERGDQPFGLRFDILPMEEALPFFAFPAARRGSCRG